MEKKLAIVRHDPWLEPYEDAIKGRHEDAIRKEIELVGKKGSLVDFANAHQYFGLHKTKTGWVFSEWAPNATAITMIGTFSDWKERDEYKLTRKDNGVWEINLPKTALKHGDLYKLIVEWDGGRGERIPVYSTRTVQDEKTYIFSAQVWEPTRKYKFKVKDFKPKTNPLLIYECHIGMAQNKEGVGTYEEFRKNILPRVVKDGYNAIQIMAIQEHPYYGSFGYHVSSFYAPSSRFGTPEELKALIDEAHANGISVIMDIVHSHAVKNEVEGLGRFDGSYNQYFYGDSRREHPAWDSLCFDYGKNEVLHFLLSNCKYWLEEFQFDGFRFDGVTSMLYYNHGLGQAFTSYADYYNGGQDTNAITYLTLANKLIHKINPHAITIAEEMSGMPGLANKFNDGGIGFDYRMAMGIPDFWIKTIKEKKDEDWKPSAIFWELTNRRADEKTINYAESHYNRRRNERYAGTCQQVQRRRYRLRLPYGNGYPRFLDQDHQGKKGRGLETVGHLLGTYQPSCRRKDYQLCRKPRPGTGGRQDYHFPSYRLGNVLAHDGGRQQHDRRPRHDTPQDDSPRDTRHYQRRLPQLHG